MIESLASHTGYHIKLWPSQHRKFVWITRQPVTESTEAKIIWDFTINTDRKIAANQPDITIKFFEENTYILIDVPVSTDKNSYLKKLQKLSNYKDLKIDVTKMWKLRSKTILVLIGFLGMIKKVLKILLVKSLVNHCYRKCRKCY